MKSITKDQTQVVSQLTDAQRQALREKLNQALEIDPEVLKSIHGGGGCECCKWEPTAA